MRVGHTGNTLNSVKSPPDAVRWVNLLSAFVFTMFCTLMCHPQSWGDALVPFFFYGMIFGPVIFLMTSAFSSMCGGKSSWWVSIACLVLIALICGYFLYRSYWMLWI